MDMEGITYAQAVAEIEQIIRRFEGEDFDPDTMAAQVARATELIKFCRAKLQKAADETAAVLGEE